MNQNNLDRLLQTVKNESINFDAIDSKTQRLIHYTPRLYIAPKASFITAAVLFAIVSLLGSYNFYQQKQYMAALEQLEQERASVLSTEYFYSTIASAYSGVLGE